MGYIFHVTPPSGVCMNPFQMSTCNLAHVVLKLWLFFELLLNRSYIPSFPLTPAVFVKALRVQCSD